MKHRRAGRRGAQGEHVPPKIPEKYFFAGNFYVKLGHFSGKKIMQNWGILLIFGQI